MISDLRESFLLSAFGNEKGIANEKVFPFQKLVF